MIVILSYLELTAFLYFFNTALLSMGYHSFVPASLSGFNYAEFLIVNLEVIVRHVRISLPHWKIYSTLYSVTFSFSCELWDKKFIQGVSNISASSVTEFPFLFFSGLSKSLLSCLVSFFFFLNNIYCPDFYAVKFLFLWRAYITYFFHLSFLAGLADCFHISMFAPKTFF